jgi:hypothetical protein
MTTEVCIPKAGCSTSCLHVCMYATHTMHAHVITAASAASRLSALLRLGLAAWQEHRGFQSHDDLMGANMKGLTKQAAHVCIHVSLYAQHTMSARVKHSGERCRQLALCLMVTRSSAASTQRLCMDSWMCEQQAAHVVYSCVHL